jgi:hypothetical protein
VSTPLGLNLPGDPRYSVDEIAATGAKLVRLPLRFEFDLTHFLRGCQQRGIQTMLIGDSHPDSLGTDESVWKFRIRRADLRYGGMVDYWVWGNEWDAEPGAESSWVMDPEDLNELNLLAAEIQPTRQRWLAGCCSGQPSRLDDVVLSGLSGICIHPYAKSPGSPDLEEMLQGYLSYGLSVGITEYDSRTPGMSAYLANDRRLAFALAFSYHDDVTGFGLVDQQGNKRPSYFEFQQAAGALDSGVPDTGGVTPMAEFVLGFKEKADELGAAVVGTPLEAQDYLPLKDGGEIAFQFTTTGVMIYSKKANKAHFLAGR